MECNALLSAEPAIEIPALQGERKAQPRKSRSAARCSKPSSEHHTDGTLEQTLT